jgi:hypothetical protein
MKKSIKNLETKSIKTVATVKGGGLGTVMQSSGSLVRSSTENP